MSDTIKKLHCPLGLTEKKVNEMIDWLNALCNMHDFQEHYHLSALQSNAPTQPANLASHKIKQEDV